MIRISGKAPSQSCGTVSKISRKSSFAARLQRGRRQRLDINIGFTRPDDPQRLGFVPRHFMRRIAESDLHGDSGHRLASIVGDPSVQVRHFAASQVRRLAHLESADREVRCVRIGRRGDRSHRRRALPVPKDQHNPTSHSQHDRCGHHHGQPVALLRRLWSAQVGVLCSRARLYTRS